jgi:thioredoxin
MNACAQAGSQVLAPAEYKKAIDAEPKAQILDVRTAEEFAGDKLTGSKNIDIYNPNFLTEAEKSFDKQKTLYVYCLAGGRSAEAASQLSKAGFKNVVNLKGGINGWRQSGLPLGNAAEVATPSNTAKVWTDAELQQAITKNKNVILDFQAKWCKPCKEMQPTLDKINTEGKATVLSIDIDANRALTKSNKITEIPVLLVYKEGKQVMRFEGLQTEANILKVLK